MCTEEILNLLRRLKSSEGGAAAVEYAILAALIAGAIILAVTNIGTALANVFNNISNTLSL